jgi:ABC-type Fe3+/spermidine/putrescine transport system ATPase subunit
MFSLQNVQKRFGDLVAVAGIDLDVPIGTTLALIGASGSGKSTVLRLMLELEQPDSGEVRFAGDPVTDRTALRSHPLSKLGPRSPSSPTVGRATTTGCAHARPRFGVRRCQ